MEDNYFSKWIKENIYPACIVFSTDTAKRIIGKNNLTPAEFLRPFGNFSNQVLNMSLGEKGNISINDLRLDFYDSEDYQKKNASLLSSLIDNVLVNSNNYPEWSLNELKITKYNLEPLLSKLKYFSFPWFNEFEQTFFEFIHFNEYEMYQQPFVYIYICSIKDNPDIIAKQQNKETQPYLIAYNIYETNMPVLIIVLNDKSDSENWVSNRDPYFLKFRNRFSTNYIAYWEINTQTKDEMLSDIWSEYIHKYDIYNPLMQNKYQHLGKLISKDERNKFKTSLFSFMKEHGIIVMQKMAINLDLDITNKKRGLKNAFFSIIARDEKVEYNSFYDCYQLNMIEKEMYLLSIIYFYFGNYEGAKDNLNLLLSQIEKKSLKHYNAIYELYIISQFLSLSSSRDSNLDKPYQLYLKNEQYHQAFRALLILIKIYEQLQRFRELPSILITAVSNLPHSASKGFNPDEIINRLSPLFYEKLSIYYLLSNKRLFKKFSLYTILCGIAYHNEKGDFNRYTLNAFGNIISFIDQKNRSFRFIKEYLNRQMGEICEYLQYYEGGMNFYKNYIELRNETNNNIITQYEHFLNCIINVKANNSMNQLGSTDVTDLSIPEIDNSSLIIIEEQDYQIAEDENAHSGWKWFNKYQNVPLKKIYINLSQNDLISIKNLDNIIDKMQNFSNFYSKRNFNGNVNNKIYVRFTMSNPLSFDLQITGLKLLCDYVPLTLNINPEDQIEKEMEYQSIALTLPKLSSKEIELYCKPLLSGNFIIKGVQIILDSIAIVKHYFNQRIIDKLYTHRIKRKSSSLNERKSSTSSHPGALSNRTKSNSSLHRQVAFNRKTDITFTILDNKHDITVSFPQGNSFDVYKNELLLIPILIQNNSTIRIKSFCLFFHEEDSSHNEKNNNFKSVLGDYIFKDIELVNDPKKPNAINQATTYIPIVPFYIGNISIKILIKFETDRNKEIEAKRYIIKLNVKESISLNIRPHIINYTSEASTNDKNKSHSSTQNKRKVHFCLEATSFINDRTSLSDLKIGNKIFINKQYERIPQGGKEDDWTVIDNNNYTKLYTKLYFLKEIKETNSHRFTFQRRPSHFEIQELPFLSQSFNEDSKQNITYKINKLLQKDTMIITWNCREEKENRDVFGLFFYHEQIKSPTISPSFAREVIKSSSQISDIKQYPLSNGKITLITFTFTIDKKLFGELSDIARYEIYINDESSEFNWTGLKKYKVENKNIFTKNTMVKEEAKLLFSCTTEQKGVININHLTMKIEFYKERIKDGIVIKSIPYPILIEI